MSMNAFTMLQYIALFEIYEEIHTDRKWRSIEELFWITMYIL